MNMDRLNARPDDFTSRREHLHEMNDEELKAYFWELTAKVVDPLVSLARTHTTPSIERSVLLRMGFSDQEAKTLVDKVIEYQLMGKGAGNVVFVFSRLEKIDVRTAGLRLLGGNGWDKVLAHFGGASR